MCMQEYIAFRSQGWQRYFSVFSSFTINLLCGIWYLNSYDKCKITKKNKFLVVKSTQERFWKIPSQLFILTQIYQVKSLFHTNIFTLKSPFLGERFSNAEFYLQIMAPLSIPNKFTTKTRSYKVRFLLLVIATFPCGSENSPISGVIKRALKASLILCPNCSCMEKWWFFLKFSVLFLSPHIFKQFFFCWCHDSKVLIIHFFHGRQFFRQFSSCDLDFWTAEKHNKRRKRNGREGKMKFRK